MRSLIAFFVRNPVVVNLVMLLFIAFGYLGFKSTKATFFPNEDIKFVNVDVRFPGASPGEVEEGVIIKIEDNLKSVSGIERFVSVSRENAGNISIELKSGYDPNQVLQDVQNAVNRIASFPAGLEPPVVYKLEIENFTFSFAISGDVDLLTLKKVARKIENDFRAQDGISKVRINGFPAEEIEIAVREADLRALNLTFEEVANAVRRANLEISGGVIKSVNEEISIRARAKEYYSDGLNSIVVRAERDGRRVLLRDVATVRDQWEDRPVKSWANGKPAVIVVVNNTNDEDLFKTADFIRNYVKEFNTQNELVKIDIINDRSIPLRDRIQLLVKNGISGAFLVVLFLALSLNLRLSFWTAIGIPVSFLGMFALGGFYGLTINALSLFGMIIVVGILVDDGIVVVENIFQHYERGESAFEAAVNGTIEVLPSIFSAVATTVAAFSFFFFIEGRIGELFSDIAFVVVVTLLVSLVEVMIMLPAHVAHSKALKRGFKPSRLEQFFNRLVLSSRDRLYRPLLAFFLEHRVLAIVIPVGLLLILIGSIRGGIVKTTFFPIVEQEAVQVQLELAIGKPEEETYRVLSMIEQKALEMNEAYKAADPEGNALVRVLEKTMGPLSHQGTLTIQLLNAEKRTITAFAAAGELRKRTGNVPEAQKLTFGTAAPFGKPIQISLTSSNLEELRRAKDDFKAMLRERPALKDIIDNDQVGLTEVDVKLKPEAYNLGLNLQTVLSQVRAGFFGLEVQRLQRGIDEVKVWVRYQHADRSTLSQLEAMYIRTPDGRSFPLREIAELTLQNGVVAINHQNGKREITVSADVADPRVSVTDEVAYINSTLLPELYQRYPSIRATFEGQSREAAKSARSAQKVGPALLVVMFALMVLTFHSYLQAAVVLLLVPLSLVGVGAGHFIHNIPISIFSALGIIALTGVLVNDSLVFISTLNAKLKEGEPFKTAVLETAVSRFRAIVLTSLTTIAGLAPIVLEKSFQAQFLIPMAVSIAYGLVMSTNLTLLVLPVLLTYLNDARRWFFWLWHGYLPSAESVEPANKELHQFDENEK
jgi:multidrug efflux pump subunit AcrB